MPKTKYRNVHTIWSQNEEVEISPLTSKWLVQKIIHKLIYVLVSRNSSWAYMIAAFVKKDNPFGQKRKLQAIWYNDECIWVAIIISTIWTCQS